MPLVEEITPCPDVMAALAAWSHEPNVVLLESALLREGVGRYSFLVANPVTTITTHKCRFGENPLAGVKSVLSAYRSESLPDLPPFQGGVVGLLGYDAGRAWEKIPRAGFDEFSIPDVVLGVYDWVIAWDHKQQRCWIIAHGSNAADNIRAARKRLNQPIPEDDSQRWKARSESLGKNAAPQFPVPVSKNWVSDFSRDGYLRAVERVIEYIFAGDIFQANLSQRLLTRTQQSPLELYGRLRTANPAPFAAYFQYEDFALASASPERFLAVDEGIVETRPIKGTRRRQPVPEADLYTRDVLRESKKDQAENVMIVDLLRNDLSRVCQPGSLTVPALCNVETYETVQHLVSVIRGKLSEDCDMGRLLEATFPGGSITGAPKVRAMEIIEELEPTVRGPYCGTLFYAGFNGQFDSSILIRTLVWKDGWVQCSAGGGIVAQSDPIAEYEETWHKAEAMLKAFESP